MMNWLKSIIKRQNKVYLFDIFFLGRDIMKVKIFDESHEKDLENDINDFFKENNVDVFDIKFSVGVSLFSEEQIYCFSALIMYNE